MKLVGKVPVEPLDDERLTNIERKLVVAVSEMRRPPARAPRRVLALAGAAVAVIAAGVFGWKLRGDGAPPSSEPLAMAAGALDLGDAQITGKDFTVLRAGARVEIVMSKPGKLELSVEHRPERLYVVRVGDVVIEDVGTRFSVDYDGKHVDVRVTEGEVKVKHAGKVLAIAAGGAADAWGLDIGAATIAQLDEQRAREAAAQQSLVALAPGDTDGGATAGDATSRTDRDGPATRRGHGSGSATGDGSATGSDTAGGGGPGSGSDAASGGGLGSGARRRARPTNARKALDHWPIEPPVDVGTEEPKAAIEKYRGLLRSLPEEDDKTRILYSIAVMQHRAKQDRDAKYTISGILKRPASPAYRAALWLHVRINCLKAFDDECRFAAQKYIAAFESGSEAGIAVDILKEISRGP
jgi:hypothetical protein